MASSPVTVIAGTLPVTLDDVSSSLVTAIVGTSPVMLGDVPSSPGMPVSASSPAIDSDCSCDVSTVPVVQDPLNGSALLVCGLLAP